MAIHHQPFSLQSEITATLLGILLWVPLSLFVGPLALIFFLFHRFVHKVAKKYRPDLIPLSMPDYFLVPAASNADGSTVYTCQVWNVQGPIELNLFRRHFYHCFLAREEDRVRYANLYCFFVQFMGYVFKKKVKSIDLEHQIQEVQEGEYGTVEEFVGTWMVTHDVDSKGVERPAWMIKILKGSGGRTTVLFKLHHGICDGYTIVHLAGKLSGEHAPYLFREPVPPLAKKLKCLLQFPFVSLKVWFEMSRGLKKTMVQKSSLAGETWHISFTTLDLKTVKEVRRVTRTSFVSVLMSLQVGALKRLMREFGTTGLQETYMGHSMGWPDHPVMTKGGGMGNHLTVNMVKSSMTLDDPLEQLMDIDSSFKETIQRGYPIMGFYGMLNICKITPTRITRLVTGSGFSLLGMETGLSSLLCSGRPHYLMGEKVENLYLPVLTQSSFPKLKLMTVPVSHSGILDISVNASSALIKNQEGLDRVTKVYFKEELEELRRRCQNLVE